MSLGNGQIRRRSFSRPAASMHLANRVLKQLKLILCLKALEELKLHVLHAVAVTGWIADACTLPSMYNMCTGVHRGALDLNRTTV